MILVLVYVGAVAVLFLFVVMMLGGDILSTHQSVLPDWPSFLRSVFQVSLFLIVFLGFSFGALYLGSWWYGTALSETLESLWRAPLTGFDAYFLASLLTGLILGRVVLKRLLNASVGEAFKGFIHSFPLSLFVIGLIFGELVALGVLWGTSVMAPEYTSAPIPTPDQVPNTQALGQLIYTDYFYAFQIGGMILLLAMVGTIVLTLRHGEKNVRRQNVADQVSRTKEDTLRLNKVMVGKGVDI